MTNESVANSVFSPFEVPTVRTAVAGGAIARTLVHRIVGSVDARLRYPDGTEVGGGGPASPVLELVRPTHTYRRLERHPKIGFGEGYMAGDWRAAPGTDLAELLMPFAARMGQLLPPALLRWRWLVDRSLPVTTRNTPTGSRSNIQAHYDLSNEMFAAFLDPTMSYSSALFDESEPLRGQDLVQGQHRKIDAILDAAGVGDDARVLEIGTGWGELAIRAARRGAHVVTITLSTEQKQLAEERIAAAGVSDRVEVRVEDYREVRGEFDAVVSVEMIEAVGEEFWPTYFATVDARLAPGGTAVVQAILMDHQRLLATRRSYGWIQKYIFPGGLIPSRVAIEEVTRIHTSLAVTEARSFGLHYAETLRQWRIRFLEQWPRIEHGQFDERFKRMWEFYLAYCEAGFAARYLEVAQISLTRPR